MVTGDGIEGGAVYALSARLRDAIAARGPATLTIDLRPDMAEADLALRLATAARRAVAGQRLRKAAALTPVAITCCARRGRRPAAASPSGWRR